MSRPNFIIVGAARAGTTSLYYYLKQHPDIAFPDRKEPKYFSSLAIRFPQNGPGDSNIDKYIVKNIEQYYRLFENLEAERIGEASPDYLYYHTYTARAIYEELGDIPIIISLRNPIERAFSAYSYLRRENREELRFEEAIEKEEARLKNNYDFMWAYKHYSLYSDKVQTFLSTFSNVKIILCEQLNAEPSRTISELLDFLGVDASIKPDVELKHNVSGTPNNRFAKFILNRNSKIATQTRELLKTCIPRRFLEMTMAKCLKSTTIQSEYSNHLRNFFINDAHALNKIITQDLFKWWNI